MKYTGWCQNDVNVQGDRNPASACSVPRSSAAAVLTWFKTSGARQAWLLLHSSVAMALCTTVHSLYNTRLTNIFGTSIPEPTMQPNPTPASRMHLVRCIRFEQGESAPRRRRRPGRAGPSVRVGWIGAHFLGRGC